MALSTRYGAPVSSEDVLAYIVAITAHPAYIERFRVDLSTPGLRVPLTANPELFAKAAEVGRLVIWLYTFGERMSDAKGGRPAGPPRLPASQRPSISAKGAISQDPALMPDNISYDDATKRLLVGDGYIDNVERAVWDYAVSGKQILLQWFSSRRRTRDRPILGDRRPPSPLSAVQPPFWLAEYTTELLNLLNVLGWLVEVEPTQNALMESICSGPIISLDDLNLVGALAVPAKAPKAKTMADDHPDLFE